LLIETYSPICAKHISLKEAKTAKNDNKPSSPSTIGENVPARRQANDEPKPATPSPRKIGPEKPGPRTADPSNQKPSNIHEKEFRSFKRIICLTSMESSNPSSGTMGVGSTRAIKEFDMEYLYRNGRRYCGEYYMPNDEEEQTRMQMLHSAYMYMLGGRLTTVALQNPTKILDVGTGCGDWALGMGDEYPEAEVIGTDIAPIQPNSMPPNTYFMIEDAEDGGGWIFEDNEFDLIHFRSMVGAFADWNHIYKETYKHLKAGGWFEVIDFDDYEGILRFFPPGSQIENWLVAIAEGSRKSGRPRGTMHLEHSQLIDLGFVDVSTEEYSIPMGVWPNDIEANGIGKLFMISQLRGIEALGLRVLTEQMGWVPVGVRAISNIISNEVKALFQDSGKAKGLGFNVRVMKGKKPTGTEHYHLVESMSTMRKRKNAYVQDEGVHGV
jgi:hypothetical protein